MKTTRSIPALTRYFPSDDMAIHRTWVVCPTWRASVPLRPPAIFCTFFPLSTSPADHTHLSFSSTQTQVHTVQHKRNASKRLTLSRAKLTCQTHIWWWSSLCLPRRCISHLGWWWDMWPVVCVLSTTWSLLGLELWARRDVTVMSQTGSNSSESRCTAANENNTHFFGYQSLQFAFLFQLRRMKKNKCLWDNRLL